jgi:oxalate decarboxylase/phosphoglucose isomerase-like protein (cupin superfamily)
MLKPAHPMTDSEDDPTQWPREPIVTLLTPFTDDRGEIQPLVDLPMRSGLLIRTRPGGIRANHYHKTDWHYIYVIKGQFEYYYRPVDSTEKPIVITVKTGQLLWTPPMLEHAMLYTEECDIIVFARNGRSQEEYERDVVRVKLI